VRVSADPAASMHRRLVRHIRTFEEGLKDSEEVGCRLAAWPGEPPVHLDDVWVDSVDMLVFCGRSVEGRPVLVLQHFAQLNLVLTPVPARGAIAKRIGATLGRGASRGHPDEGLRPDELNAENDG
jgi:hypothetical protein